MRPSLALERKRRDVLSIVRCYKAVNPRVFGSVLQGNDLEDSDLDLLVDVLPGATLFDLGGLQEALEEILGVRVDLVTPNDLPPKFRQRVLAQAQPL